MPAPSNLQSARPSTKVALAIFAVVEVAFVVLMFAVFLQFPQNAAPQLVMSHPLPAGPARLPGQMAAAPWPGHDP